MNTSHFHDSNHLVNLFANLQSLSFQDKFTDLRFVCANGETVNAHKLLFCSVSKQLKNMISDLPTGLDIIIINVPDIVRSKLSCIVEFMYTGILKILPQEFIEYQEILTLLGIELNNQKPTMEGPCSQVYGQNSMMSHVNPVLNLPRQMISPSCFGLQQVQNQHTAFIPDSQPNTPIPPNGPHMFTNQPAGVTPNNPTLSYPDFVNQNTKSSPNCVVINAEQAYKLIKQSSVQSVVQKIKNNPEVSLIPTSSTVSNILENQNTNHTNTEVVIDVEEDGNSMHCVVENVFSLHGESIENLSKTVIDLEHSEGINSKNAFIETECITLDDEEEPVHVRQSGPNNLNTEHTNVMNNSVGEPILSTVINKSVNSHTNVVNNLHGEPTSPAVINKRVNINVVNNSHGEPTSSTVINKRVNGNTNIVNNSYREPTSSTVISKRVSGNTNVVNNSHGELTSSTVISKRVSGNTNVVNNSHGEPTSSTVISKRVSGNTNVVNNSHGELTSCTVIRKHVNGKKRGRPKKNQLTDSEGIENNESALKEKAPVTNSVKRKRRTNIGKKPSHKTQTSTSRKRKLKPTSLDVPVVEGDSKEMSADSTILTTEANDKDVSAEGQTLNESNIESNQFTSRGPCVERRYSRRKIIVPKWPSPLKKTY